MEDSEGKTCTGIDEELDFSRQLDDKGHTVVFCNGVFCNGGWKVIKGAWWLLEGRPKLCLLIPVVEAR